VLLDNGYLFKKKYFIDIFILDNGIIKIDTDLENKYLIKDLFLKENGLMIK